MFKDIFPVATPVTNLQGSLIVRISNKAKSVPALAWHNLQEKRLCRADGVSQVPLPLLRPGKSIVLFLRLVLRSNLMPLYFKA